jgi:hypothetical protein
LLAGDDHSRGGIGEPGRRVAGGCGRATIGLLRRDQARDLKRLALVTLRPRNRIGPRRRRGGIAGKERRDLREIESVVGRQAPNPRKCSDVHSQRIGGSGRDVGWHCDVLSQTVTNTVNLA